MVTPRALFHLCVQTYHVYESSNNDYLSETKVDIRDAQWFIYWVSQNLPHICTESAYVYRKSILKQMQYRFLEHSVYLLTVTGPHRFHLYIFFLTCISSSMKAAQSHRAAESLHGENSSWTRSADTDPNLKKNPDPTLTLNENWWDLYRKKTPSQNFLDRQ